MSNADEIYGIFIAPIEKQMMRTVYRIVQDPDDAADAFQDALLKVWKYMDRILCHPNPHGYILCICVSAAQDTLRKRNRRRLREKILDPAIEHPAPAPSADAPLRELVERVQCKLADLPHRQSQAVFLRLVEEQSFTAIGAALQCSEATARSHVSKGLARLKQLLSSVIPLAKERES